MCKFFQHGSSLGSRGLQLHNPNEVDELRSGGLLNQEAPRTIHTRFPTAPADNETVRVTAIPDRPAQQLRHPRIDLAEPSRIPYASVN